MKDQANAEVVGSLLVIAVLVTAIFAAAPGILATEDASNVPELQIVADASPGSSVLTMTRTGGASVDLSMLRVMVTNGTEILYDGPAGNAGDTWNLGQTLTVGPLSRQVTSADKADVSVVFMAGAMGHLITTEPVLLSIEPGPGSAGGLTITALGTTYEPTAMLTTENFLAVGEVNHTGGRKMILSVMAEVPSLVPPTPLADDGTMGDADPGDGRYSAYFTIPVNALPGVYPVLITATDITGNRLTNVTFVEIQTPEPPTGEMEFAPPPSSSPPPPSSPPPSSSPPPPSGGGGTSPPTGTACFTILPNGGVASLQDQPVQVKVIGTEITYGVDGPSIPVRVWHTKDGGSSLSPMNNGNPITAGQAVQIASLAGNVVGVRGSADYLTVFNYAYNSYVADPHVSVLKNGTAAPNVPAFGSQTSIETYLQPYVVDGKMNILESQVIVLFEFTPSLTSSAADFQDLVMLFEYPAGCVSS